MTLTFSIGGVDIGQDRVRFREGIQGFTTATEQAIISFGGVIIDDPLGELDIVGWRTFTVDEDACTPSRMWTGYVTEKKIKRGSLRADASRIWDCDLLDINAVLTFRAITGADGKRPAETDVARVAWLLGSDYLDGLIFDNGLVNLTDNIRLLGETDYRHQTPQEAFNEFTARCGKNVFAYYDHASGQVSLFYDLPTAQPLSTKKVSNVLTDHWGDPTVVFPPTLSDATLTRSPADQVGGIDFQYAGGKFIYRQNSTTIAAMGFVRDLIYSTPNVGALATAEAQAALILADHATEDDQINFSMEIEAQYVNLIGAGMRLTQKWSHLPGYEAFVEIPLIRHTVRQIGYDRYLLTLESRLVPALSAGPGGTGEFPHDCPDVGVNQVVGAIDNATMPGSITAGSTMVYASAKRDSTFVEPAGQGYAIGPDGDTKNNANNDYVGIFTKTAGVSEPTTLSIPNNEQGGAWLELPGAWVIDQHDKATGNSASPNAGPITVAPNSIVVFVCGAGEGGVWDSGSSALTWTDPGAWTRVVPTAGDPSGRVGSGHPNIWAGYLISEGGGSYSGSPTFSAYWTGSTEWAAQIMSFVRADDCPPPEPGQWVYGEVVTMSGTSGTTQFAYAAGSLKVKVDGVLISPASYTETDNTTGDFDLDWIVDADETVTVDYQGI